MICPFCGNSMKDCKVFYEDEYLGMISYCDWCGYKRSIEGTGWSLGIINQREVLYGLSRTK